VRKSTYCKGYINPCRNVLRVRCRCRGLFSFFVSANLLESGNDGKKARERERETNKHSHVMKSNRGMELHPISAALILDGDN
jgi:hypothetical protein